MADGRFPVHTENFFMIRIFLEKFSSFFFVWSTEIDGFKTKMDTEISPNP
uniref:Uncharacterized protein n=1 Tax=Arundo donax TaxID=35708 RepID=A0A0A9AG61_ARUDO